MESENKKQHDHQSGLGIEYPIDPNSKKLYAVGCDSADDWCCVHNALINNKTIEDNIPHECIECFDLKEHSSTRAVYLLTDVEAEELLKHPKVKYVHENFESYPCKYKPDPEEVQAGYIRNYRYDAPGTRQYRNWYDSSQLPISPTSAELNRSGYQLLRCVNKEDPWHNGLSTGSDQIITDRIQYYGDGSGVDIIVGDEGCWFGHVEFQSNATGFGPTNYVGGNLLRSGFSSSSTTGTCDLLDLVLDAPYYIDPEWFEASPSTRLTLRWDGTTVPVDSVAIAWWSTANQRSSAFDSIGTVTVTSAYTRVRCNGSNTSRPTISTTHGTQCTANAVGRTQGWAFNANKWSINVYGTDGSDFEPYYDLMKLFHLHKPINSQYGTKDPTISSNSWGYRATQGTTGYYYYRVGDTGTGGIQYSSKPAFMQYVGLYGDDNRMKGEHLPNSSVTAGKEMIDAGVIFVAAAGNANQKQVSSDHPDFNNYWATASNTPLISATHLEFGITAYNTVNRRGYPQQLGKYNDPTTGEVIYPVINIGALDDSFASNGKERKVNYSDMGNEIDCYAPADGTLSATNSVNVRARPDTYSGSLTSFDTNFGGTSSACPVACGLIACKLQYNRSWTWQDIKNWLSNSVGDADTNQFDTGVESITATDPNWANVNSLEGGRPIVIWDAITGNEPIHSINMRGVSFSGLTIK